MKPDKATNLINIFGIGMFVFTFMLIFFLVLSDFIFHWDIAPAKGTAIGYIYYQEKSGIYQLNSVCWKDTPFEESCEVFDPAGQTFDPGKYKMDYECTMFVWAWEHPNECRILNATRLGDLSS